ncbi:MAG: hypothetical protein IPM59_07415 [Chloracidobacterium sp.]|nr:hypothetical protein [Chloracidobacterium sp.]
MGLHIRFFPLDPFIRVLFGNVTRGQGARVPTRRVRLADGRDADTGPCGPVHV